MGINVKADASVSETVRKTVEIAMHTPVFFGEQENEVREKILIECRVFIYLSNLMVILVFSLPSIVMLSIFPGKFNILINRGSDVG